MSNVKLNILEDEDGNDISGELNNVEQILGRIGVPLRKSATEWNNFGEVLDSLAGKWKTLNSVDQSAIATALGGVRQKEAVITMMENYDKALKYEKTALESSGTALEKFNNAYLGSIEAKTNAFKASFESFSMSIINSNVLKTITDIGSATLSWLDGTDRLIPTFYRVLGVATAIGVVLKRNAIAASLQSYGQLGIAKTAISAGAAGVSTATTTAADALRAAQINNVANATTRLTGANLAAFASYAKLSQAEVINILTTQGLTEAEIEAEVVKLKSLFATNSQTVSTGAYTGALSGLILRLKQATISMLKFLATNPVGWAILAVGAVASLATIFDLLTVSVDESSKKLKESSQSLSESKSKLDELESKLSDTASRLSELKKLANDGKLTLVQQTEFDLLQKTNEELQRKIDLQKLANKDAQNEANKSAMKLSKSMDETTGTEYGDYGKKSFGMRLVEAYGEAPSAHYSANEFVDVVLEKMKGLDPEKQRYKDYLSEINLLMENYQSIVDNLVPSTKEEADALENANIQLDKMSYAFGGATARANLFEKYSKKFGDNISGLKDYLASIGFSSDEVSRYLDSLGVSAKNAIDPITEMNKSISDLKTTMDGLPERMEDLESINKKVSDGYHFSITEIDEIIKKYPQLESAVTRTAYGFQIASGAINTLSTGISFTSEEIKFLESTHGSLNATLDEATGLYYLNSDALSALGISAIQAKIDYNQFQIDTTKSAIEGARARIEALKTETATLSTYSAMVRLVADSSKASVLTQGEFYRRKNAGIASLAGYANYEDYAASKVGGVSGANVSAIYAAQKQLEEYQSQLDRIGTGSVSGYTPEKSEKAKTAKELLEEEKKLQRDAFEAQKAIIDRQLALNLITEEQYTNSLESLYKQFYSDKSKYLDEYTQYEIEVYNKRQSLLEQAQKGIESLHKATIDMIKQEMEEKKKALEKQKDNLKEEKEAEEKALEKKKDNLREYTDARKKALQDARDQDAYDKQIREKSKDIESIKAQLLGLSGDMSGAGMRKKTELNQALKDAQDDLGQAVSDRQYDSQIDAIDSAYETQEKIFDAQVENINSIYEAQEKTLDSQIESIDSFLDNQGNLVQEAFNRMNGMSATLKSQLIAYNQEYGSGISNDIVKNWDAATKALMRYGSVANTYGTLTAITSSIGRPVGYATGTSGLKRDSIIVGTHELLLNKTGSNAYQMMNAGSPIFTEQQTNALKALLSSPSSLLTKSVGGVGLNNASTIMSMVNSNNSQDIDLHYEFNISGTDPIGIESAITKLLPKIKDYTLSAINKDVQFSKGVRLTAANMA